MDSFEMNRRNSKRKKDNQSEMPQGAYGITKPGRYYFPGKITSGFFDQNGIVSDQEKRGRAEDLYDDSIERQYDPLGMYSGIPSDKYDAPVQDADDL